MIKCKKIHNQIIYISIFLWVFIGYLCYCELITSNILMSVTNCFVWNSADKCSDQPSIKHTYLAQGIPWSIRRFPQVEALPLHSGWADPCDHPKCGWLGCAIFVRGGLRSRYPLKIHYHKNSVLHTVFLLDIQNLIKTPVALFLGNLCPLLCHD